ncbi:MAG: hypothetical protein MI785_26110 [Kiloniellales bacterium]|nr:hypothetical protein [Kiloniellales bacterium]
MGGRTWANIERRYQCRGLTGGAMHDEIIRGAQKSNATVNTAAMRGASMGFTIPTRTPLATRSAR